MQQAGCRLRAYLDNGGPILLNGCPGRNMEKSAFALDVGADFGGFSEFRPDYMVPGFETVNGRTEYVMYSRGVMLENVAGEVFARLLFASTSVRGRKSRSSRTPCRCGMYGSR